MAIQQIDAKVTAGDRAGAVFTANIDLPETIDEAREKWGDEITFSHLNANIVIAAQGAMRALIRKDTATPETVQVGMADWKPGVKARGKSAKEKAMDLFSSLSPEEKAELLAELA